ncbi:MAG: hypothetical protein ABIK12_14150 [Pseudomonadota bacterium]
MSDTGWISIAANGAEVLFKTDRGWIDVAIKGTSADDVQLQKNYDSLDAATPDPDGWETVETLNAPKIGLPVFEPRSDDTWWRLYVPVYTAGTLLGRISR